MKIIFSDKIKRDFQYILLSVVKVLIIIAFSTFSYFLGKQAVEQLDFQYAEMPYWINIILQTCLGMCLIIVFFLFLILIIAIIRYLKENITIGE